MWDIVIRIAIVLRRLAWVEYFALGLYLQAGFLAVCLSALSFRLSATLLPCLARVE